MDWTVFVLPSCEHWCIDIPLSGGYHSPGACQFLYLLCDSPGGMESDRYVISVSCSPSHQEWAGAGDRSVAPMTCSLLLFPEEVRGLCAHDMFHLLGGLEG